MPSFNNNTNDNNNNRRFAPNNNNGDVSFNNKVPTVDIYNLTATTLYTIPKSEVVHVPPQQQLPPAPAGRANATDGKGLTILQHTKKMTLCEHFNTAEGCRLGNRCPNVHARLTHPAVKINDDIHVNFAYFEPAHVKYYERFSEQRAPGDTANAPAHYWPKFLLVAPPNETSPVDEIPIKYCLKTAAFFKPGRIASHCAHFYYNRVCARGSRCFFVHAISFAGPRETNVMKHNSKHLKMHNNTNGNQQDDDVESCCSDDARAPENHEFEEVFIENEKGEKIKMNKIKSTTQVLEDGTPRRSWGRTQPFRDFGSGAFLKEFRKQQQQQQQGEQSLLPLPNSVAKQQQQQQVQQKIIITSQQQQLVVNVAPPLMQQQQITKPITSSLGFAAAFGGHSPALHNNARVNVVRSNGNASPMDSTYQSSNSSSMMMMGNFSPSSSPVIQQQQQQHQQPQVFVLNNNLQLLQHQQQQNNHPHQQQQQQYFRGQQQQQLNNNFTNGYGLTPVSPANHQQQQSKQQQHNPMMMIINNNNNNNLMMSNQSFCSSAAQTPHCIDLTPKSDDGGLHNNHHNHHLLAMSSSSSASTTSSRCADDDVVFVKTPQAKKQQQNVVRVVRRSTTVPSSPSPSPKKKNCIQHNPYSWTKTTIHCSGF